MGLSFGRDLSVFQHTLSMSLALLRLVALLESYTAEHTKAWHVCAYSLGVFCLGNHQRFHPYTGSLH